MFEGKTPYDIVNERLDESEKERETLISSAYYASEVQRAYNKGMRKAYSTLKTDLEQSGLANSALTTTDVG